MDIQGRLLEVLQPKSGQSSRGTWKKQEFILETNESFPKKICIANWNDKIDISTLKPGDEVTVSVNIESREYNGNWYTDIKAWKVDVTRQPSSDADNQGLPGIQGEDAPPPPWENDPGESDQDLPF